MYIGRPIHFESEKVQPGNRFRLQLAVVVFALLAIVGPIIFARMLATHPGGEIPAFMGP